MNMDPRAFLALAKKLLENEKNQAGLRSTVGRAYYAAFNVAVEFLSGIGCNVPKDANGHKKAYFCLNNCNDQSLVEAGGDLDNLRGFRNVADYDMGEKNVEKEDNVANWLELAEEVINTLDECKNGSAKRLSDVSAAIKNYRSATGV
jgi:uncharacterized protein (UPF0332 family)